MFHDNTKPLFLKRRQCPSVKSIFVLLQLMLHVAVKTTAVEQRDLIRHQPHRDSGEKEEKGRDRS
jgi:hypothetical protein